MVSLKLVRISMILLIAFTMNNCQAQFKYAFQNPALPVESRIDNIISLLNLEEKISCLSTNPTVARLNILGTGHTEGLHGLALGIPGGWGKKNSVATTMFPQSIGMAETWDTSIIKKAASIEGYEARYYNQLQGVHAGLVIRAPNADLGRDPRWGRTEECFGEDAFFNGTLVVAYIHGLQGNDPRYWQAASLMKHFLANSNEYGRDSSSSDFDERLLREYYSVPFRMGVIQGGSRAFMASYNSVNGMPQTVSPMLTNMATLEWGQNGIICTDGGAYKLLRTAHKYVKTPEEAAAACIKAGINQFLDNYVAGVKGALELHLLTEKDIDKVLRGVFRVMIKLGLLDAAALNQYSIVKSPAPYTDSATRSFVRYATGQSIVLLKNQNALLPLDKNKIKSIAILGPRSAEVLSDWYSGSASYSISPLEGIRAKAGDRLLITSTTNNTLAANLAKNADLAIVCIGNDPIGSGGWAKVSNKAEGREAVDRQQLELDSAQEQLIETVYKANPKTILVLISSFPYSINWADQHVPAILHLTHSSQELGSALADVVFGDINPAGRLVQTWPRATLDLPPMMDYNIRHGRTYMYARRPPLYAFGYGLSYTSFSYTDLIIGSQLPERSRIKVTFTVKNTGKLAGDEVAQLYIRHQDSKVARPIKELKGFERIALKAGESKQVQILVKKADLAYWNTKKHAFIIEKDKIEMQIGGSSEDIRLRKTIAVY